MEATRRSFNKDFLLALATDFKRHGPQAIAKVRKYQPTAYMKICALLVPRELQVEHSGGVKAKSDEQLEAAIEAIKNMLAARDAGDRAKVIDASPHVAALPALDVVPDGPNKVMDAADAAVGARERKPRKRKAPSTPGV